MIAKDVAAAAHGNLKCSYQAFMPMSQSTEPFEVNDEHDLVGPETDHLCRSPRTERSWSRIQAHQPCPLVAILLHTTTPFS